MGDDRVVVIGSGPCGAMAAATLVERGVDVHMLDAGLRAPTRASSSAPPGTPSSAGTGGASTRPTASTRRPHSDVDWYSSLSLGGLSNYWTAAVPRFAPEDFTDGARLDERYVWPITYDDLVPFYERAERALTVTAGDPITACHPAWLATGSDCRGTGRSSPTPRSEAGPRRRRAADGQGDAVDGRPPRARSSAAITA